jgi:lipoprotein-releasing system ATP-binding protein
MSNPIVLSCQHVHKTFHQGSQALPVLCGVELQLRAGERVAVVGRSGSGKSTLLHVLAGLDTCDAGQILVSNTDVTAASNNQRAALRGECMGFVYQNHHLLPEFTAVENIEMPLRIAGWSRVDAEAAARQLLDDVGLAERASHLPSALSGGERQRVAVARALAGPPQVVLADEPTGNLDKQNASQVMSLLARLSRAYGTAFLVVTHDESMLQDFDRVLALDAGVLNVYAG